MTGFFTLFYKEWLRSWKVSVQTVLAPVVTSLLSLGIVAASFLAVSLLTLSLIRPGYKLRP